MSAHVDDLTTAPSVSRSNIFEPRFDQRRREPGYRSLRSRIGRQLGAKRLAASVWEIEPGQAACPYHYHHGDEELLFVLTGLPSVRTPDGWRDLGVGDAVGFPAGADGAHQVVNRTEHPVSVLLISTAGAPDVCTYPDSDKLGVSLPTDGSAIADELYFRRDATADYYDGEQRAG